MAGFRSRVLGCIQRNSNLHINTRLWYIIRTAAIWGFRICIVRQPFYTVLTTFGQKQWSQLTTRGRFIAFHQKSHDIHIIRTASTWGFRICIVCQPSISFWPLSVKYSGHSWPLMVVSLDFIKSSKIYTSLEPSQLDDSKFV